MPFLNNTDKIAGQWSDDGEHFKLSAPVVYLSSNYRTHDDQPIYVPEGFVTDFASSWVGRFNLLSRKASFSAAAVLHDWLYYQGRETKDMADLMFREALESQGVGAYDRWKAYWGVRLFGGSAWAAHRERDWTKTFKAKYQ